MTGWSATGWTSVDDLRAVLRRRWIDGSLLRGLANGLEFEPIAKPVKGPPVMSLAERLSEVQAWVRHLVDGSRSRGEELYEIEWRTVGGRHFGANELPRRLRVTTPQAVWTLLGVGREVAHFEAMLGSAGDPAIEAWVRDHPHRALALKSQWPQLLSCVEWIRRNNGHDLYLRQIDLPGVDTKFIEQNCRELAALLDLVLPPDRVDATRSPREFDARYGFRTRPAFARTRMLDGSSWLADGLTDTYARVDELAARRPDVDEVVIVENEVSYLALPRMDRVLAIFGKGFDVARLAGLPWLADLAVRYWGDIDTHGFTILDRLRAHVPHATSVLMDLDTLLLHRDLCVPEPKPAHEKVTRLTGPELTAFDYLIDNAIDGRPLRLEQERIGYASVCAALGANVAQPPAPSALP